MMSIIGDILKHQRQARNLTMRQVHVRGGPTPRWQSEVETGKRTGVPMMKFIAWCNAVGCDPNVAFALIVSSLKSTHEATKAEDVASLTCSEINEISLIMAKASRIQEQGK